MSSVRKTLKMLVWSAQNRSISCKICPENDHKIRRLFTDCFPAKFTPKIPAKSTDFSAISSPKTREIWLFFRELSEALTKWGECLALKLQLFHKLIVISSEKLILSNLGLFSHVNPFRFLYHGLKPILVLSHTNLMALKEYPQCTWRLSFSDIPFWTTLPFLWPLQNKGQFFTKI